jgi:hypothetical protein
VRKLLIAFLLLIFVPIGVSATSYWFGDRHGNWQTTDRSSAGLLPTASNHPDALIRVYAARTVRWRGIFAVHTWIVFKEQGAPRYIRYDYTASARARTTRARPQTHRALHVVSIDDANITDAIGDSSQERITPNILGAPFQANTASII